MDKDHVKSTRLKVSEWFPDYYFRSYKACYYKTHIGLLSIGERGFVFDIKGDDWTGWSSVNGRLCTYKPGLPNALVWKFLFAEKFSILSIPWIKIFIKTNYFVFRKTPNWILKNFSFWMIFYQVHMVPLQFKISSHQDLLLVQTLLEVSSSQTFWMRDGFLLGSPPEASWLTINELSEVWRRSNAYP